MMDLTPLDVRKKAEDFRRAVRGYEPAQVDTFLALVADRMEQLVSENRLVAQEVESIRTQLASYQERERALNEALLAAQELREEARSQAERDAAVRLREAETHAEAILLDADQAIRHSQRRLEDLRARRIQFLRTVRGQLERFDDFLALEETRLDGEPDELGLVTDRARTPRTSPASDRPKATDPIDSAASVDADESHAADDSNPADDSTDADDSNDPDGSTEASAPPAEEAEESEDVAFMASLEESAASANGSPAPDAQPGTDVASRLADAIEATRNRLNAEDAGSTGSASE